MKLKKSNKLIITGIVIVIILAIISIIVKPKSKLNYEEMTDEEVAIAFQERQENIKKKNLSGMGERDRMEYYVSEFIDAIEDTNYEDAYEMLYKDFRDNYFPTLDKFEEYVKTKFPKMILLEHSNIERNGDVYVLWVTLNDPLVSKDSGIEMNFVVKENDLNDYVISFSVI